MTKQIIIEAVRDVVKEEVKPIKEELSQVKTRLSKLENKVDFLTDTVIDFAGSVKKFDEEQTILSSHVSDHTNQLEKLVAIHPHYIHHPYVSV